MKNPFKKLFSKHKEDNILIYVSSLAYLCNDLTIREDKYGQKYIKIIASYDYDFKHWRFHKQKVCVDYCIVKHMKNNILTVYKSFLREK